MYLESRVEPLDPPLVIVLLLALSMPPGVGSLKWWLLILELARITAPSDQIGFFIGSYQLEALKQNFR